MATKLTAVAFFLFVLALGESTDKGEPTVSQGNGFGESAYAVHWDKDPPLSQGKGFGASAYKVSWDRDDAPSEEKGFGASAYKVSWDSDDAPSEEKGFGASAYKVSWNSNDAPSEEKGFGASAYKVSWNSDDAPSEEKGFGASSYKVSWNSDDAPSEEKGFGASAYKVSWNSDDAPSEEKGFGASAYKVSWNSDDAPSEEKGFGASACKVSWNSNGAPSEEKGFGQSAYKVSWSPHDATSEKKSFGASADKVTWSPDDAPSAAASAPKAPAKRQQIKFQTGMLFLKKNLHVGTILPEGTMFARAGAPKSVNFVYTPLESKYLTTILSHFMIPDGSTKAKQVADTLCSCGKPVDKEEPHMCFSSRQAMSRFATRELGVSGARAAITKIHGNETPNSMYVVEQITQLNNNVVPCHPMDFPYEVFYCHRPKEVQSLRVQLKGLKDGMPRVTAIAMCHMNTSDWDTRYFELLDGKRGEPICHYMPTNYIMFY